MDTRRRLSFIVAVIALGIVLWRFHGEHTNPGFEMRHLGAWTDPAGPPGNRLVFSLVWKDLPGSPMSVGEGTVTARQWLGQQEFTASWGFENSSGPLRLNVTTQQRNYVVPVEFLGDGRMRLAFHENNDRAYGPDALRGPAAMVLVPVKDVVRPTEVVHK